MVIALKNVDQQLFSKESNHIVAVLVNVVMMKLTTAGTLFLQLKFDVLKAFGMIYEITTNKKETNSRTF